MNPDDLQHAWQEQTPSGRSTVDANLLLTELARNDKQFCERLFWRDITEITIGVVLVPVWLVLGYSARLPWTWYLAVPGILWIVGFMVRERLRRRRMPAAGALSLREQLDLSLAEVRHQIWLLTNVLWWYILPVAIPAFLFVGQVGWNSRIEVWWFTAGFLAVEFAILTGILVWIYWLNQQAVRRELEPRRQELQALLASLADEPV